MAEETVDGGQEEDASESTETEPTPLEDVEELGEATVSQPEEPVSMEAEAALPESEPESAGAEATLPESEPESAGAESPLPETDPEPQAAEALHSQLGDSLSPHEPEHPKHEDHFHFPTSDDEAAILKFQQILGSSTIGDRKVDRFSDVPLRVAIELGRVNMTIGHILELREGAIVETHKLSGQPMEIMVNERLFGRGEVVVVGDNLAIRITDLKKPDLT
jgi:flagellar motor switch protein FliN/FliY